MRGTGKNRAWAVLLNGLNPARSVKVRIHFAAIRKWSIVEGGREGGVQIKDTFGTEKEASSIGGVMQEEIRG